MDKFIINGPCKLKGKVNISGSKNASLPILAATLLFDKPVEISNLPGVKDIETMLKLLETLGLKVNRNKKKKSVKITIYYEECWSAEYKYQKNIISLNFSDIYTTRSLRNGNNGMDYKGMDYDSK